MARKSSLVCGIAASVLYIAIDELGALRLPGYCDTSQALSELSAEGDVEPIGRLTDWGVQK
jgi:hypothetical protein